MLFHGSNDYTNAPQCYVHKYTAFLEQYAFRLSMKFRFYMQMIGNRLHLLAVPDIAQSTVQGEANSYWTIEENSHSLKFIYLCTYTITGYEQIPHCDGLLY